MTAVIPDSLFFAIRPDESAATQILVTAAALRDLYGLRGKLITPDRLHITLHFVGDFEEILAEHAAEAVRSMRAEPINIVLDRARSAPNRRKRRPFVLDSTAPLQKLKSFRRDLVVALRQAGLRSESRSFTPHLTLLYDEQIVEGRFIEPIRWTAREFMLVHSFFGQGRHETLGRWPLDCSNVQVDLFNQ